MKVFLFPGQGSQEVGMGADLFKSDSAFRSLVALASDLVGENLEVTCLRGPERKLTRTCFLQPLLVAVSLGYLRHLNARGVQPDLVLGHSLGEITALAAAGVVTPADAIRIAVKRGALMDEAASQADGAMLAVTLGDKSKLLEWLASSESQKGVVLANDNATTQVVLSGERSAIMACMAFIARGKLGQCRLLPVSGPWHSPLMAEAATHFNVWLRQIAMQPPRLPMLFNTTAAQAETCETIRSLISSVLARPVQWTRSMASLRVMNPRWLIEVGPSQVLSGLARANGFGDTSQVLRVGNLRGVELATQAIFAPAAGACSARPPLLTSTS